MSYHANDIFSLFYIFYKEALVASYLCWSEVCCFGVRGLLRFYEVYLRNGVTMGLKHKRKKLLMLLLYRLSFCLDFVGVGVACQWPLLLK